METSILTNALSFGNEILSSAIVLIAFSLLAYLLIHNILSPVARAFCALIACVVVVYAGDVALYNVQSQSSATFWLKFQWIGIAFVPAAYLQFSDAMLRTTNSLSRWRTAGVISAYLLSASFLGVAIWSDVLVREGQFSPQAIRLRAGPLFGLFAIYYLLTVVSGALNIRRARRRCLTPAVRRRMGYLALSFVAPALGVFPYLLLAGMPRHLSVNVFLVLLGAGNLGVAMMITVMAYSVAFFGVLTPDRVVRHNLMHYMLRGPFVGTCVIATVLVLPRVGSILGLRRDIVLVFAVVGLIVVLQVAIDAAKPFFDRLIYRRDRTELGWIQQLDQHLLTSSDLNQLLENILVTLCELLRSRSGFVLVVSEEETYLEASCGLPGRRAEEVAPQDLLQRIETADPSRLVRIDGFSFLIDDGFWYAPLKNRAEVLVGVLGISAPPERPSMSTEENAALGRLLMHAAQALQDRHLQQGVFGALATIMPQLQTVQQWRGAVEFRGAPVETVALNGELDTADFHRMVKDALSHYWGGPKLSDSPLLSLRAVQDVLTENGGSPTRALRAVLSDAIAAIKPDGQRSMTGAEWVLYNILELRFIEGRRTRDVATRLAMSESDLYRKQRIAVEEVARVLAEMERNPQDS